MIIFRLCDGMNRYGSYRLMCLSVWPIGSGTIRRYDLVCIGVVHLKKVYHCGDRH